MCALNNSKNVISVWKTKCCWYQPKKSRSSIAYYLKYKYYQFWCACFRAINIRGLWYGFLESKLLQTGSDLVVNFSSLWTGTFSIPSKVVKKLLYRLYGVWRLWNVLITFPLVAATARVAILMFCWDCHQHFRSLNANHLIIQPKFGKGLYDINESGVFSWKCTSGPLC